MFVMTMWSSPAWAPYLKSICLSMRLAVATRGSLPVERAWSSRLEEIIWVVISVSAAVPAPQQLDDNTNTQQPISSTTTQRKKFMKFEKHADDDCRPFHLLQNCNSSFFFYLNTQRLWHCENPQQSHCHLLNVGRDVVDLGAVLVCHYHALSGSGVSSKHDSILHGEEQEIIQKCCFSAFQQSQTILALTIRSGA